MCIPTQLKYLELYKPERYYELSLETDGAAVSVFYSSSWFELLSHEVGTAVKGFAYFPESEKAPAWTQNWSVWSISPFVVFQDDLLT